MDSPIILTLQMDEGSQSFFQSARDRWFPPSLDQVPAHLSLFHKLPGPEFDSVLRRTAEICAATPKFHASVAEVIGLGKGVAYRVRAERLDRLRAELAAAFQGWLTPQDRQGFRAHVTVQNKVSPATAKASRAAIEAEFAPFEVEAQGIQLWRYEGGPWGTLGAVAFGDRLR